MSIRTTLRRSVTAAAALGATAALVLSTAPAASANPLTLPDATDTWNLHVGMAAPATAVLPNGAVVTVERHNTIDLTTVAGWNAAALVDVNATGVWTAAPGSPATVTAAPGVSFPALVTGLYRVSFSNFPAGQIPPAPFLVTLPFANAAGDAWLDDVEVGPKTGAPATITKTVNDAAAVGIGSNVTWTVNAPRPALDAGQSLTEFRITDTLDPRLTFVAGSSVAEFVCPGDDTADPVIPASRVATGASIAAAGTPVVLTWTANAADLAFLNTAANAACAVELTLVTTINAAAAPAASGLTDGVIRNQAFLHINGGAGLGSGTPEVRLGQIVIEKYDATDRGNTLQGATFRLFQTSTAAEAFIAAENTLAGSGTGYVTIGSTSTWTTDTNGRVTISAVMVNNWVNNAAGTRNGWYLVEIAAPANFLLLEHVIIVPPITVWAPPPVQVEIEPGEYEYVDGYTVAIANVPNFDLPAAGGTGARMVIIGGAAFIALVAAIGINSRRRAGANA